MKIPPKLIVAFAAWPLIVAVIILLGSLLFLVPMRAADMSLDEARSEATRYLVGYSKMKCGNAAIAIRLVSINRTGRKVDLKLLASLSNGDELSMSLLVWKGRWLGLKDVAFFDVTAVGKTCSRGENR